MLPGTANSDLALSACVKAIENAGITPNDIDAIIVGTVSSDYNFPGMAPIIQRKLGITSNIPAYDISAACSAFIYLLEMGDQYIKSGKYSNVLLVGSDLMSTIIERTPEGRATGVLFGDGSGAVVLQESDDDSQILSTMEKMYINIHKYGNTTAATIPIALCEAIEEGKLVKGDNIILTAFGAGYTWASAAIKW